MSFFSKIADLINGTRSSSNAQHHGDSEKNKPVNNETSRSAPTANINNDILDTLEDNNAEVKKKHRESTFDKSLLKSELQLTVNTGMEIQMSTDNVFLILQKPTIWS